MPCPTPDTGPPAADATGAVVLCELRAEAVSVDEVLAAVADPTCGAQVIFIGRVRDHDHARQVARLGYSAHPEARERMAEVCAQVATEHDVRRVAALHRVGDLEIGDIAVVAAVASGHRQEAFAAGRDLIDRIKAETPIWKHQRFADGADEWVGLP